MKAYKILKVEEIEGVKRLVSCRVDPTMTDYFKIYAVGGVPKTVNRGLTFTKLEQAEEWAAGLKFAGQEYEIWECSGRKTSLPKRFVDLWHWADSRTWNSIRDFLRYGRKRTIAWIDDRLRNDSFPRGTVQLRDLKLVKYVVTYYSYLGWMIRRTVVQ